MSLSFTTSIHYGLWNGLAGFAQLILAILFVGPYRDPVKNIWVIQFGMIACVLVVPLALISGEARGIPFFWRLLDCSFGIVGIVPLSAAHRFTRKPS